MLKGKTVILGITGSIAAYKMANVASMLVKQHCDVRVIMTENAAKFITPLTFETLCSTKCIIDTFEKDADYSVEHIALAKKADLVLVAPATANFIAKMATGIADDMLSTTLLACRCPVYVAPAMNTAMLEHPLTQKNIKTLKDLGYNIIEPDTGRLACKDVGKGKLPDEELLVDYILQEIGKEKDFDKLRVLITAGATMEKIDPVRVITNRSTGKMGYALAKECSLRGADVTLISGKTALEPWPFVRVIDVESAEDMFNETTMWANDVDVVIKAAAVADYRPREQFDEKLKKTEGDLSIAMERTKDILKYVGEHKNYWQYVCGFSMETENMLENSRKKLESKNADMIIANNLKVPGAGFGVDTNIITIITKDDCQELPMMTKQEAAGKIMDAIRERLPQLPDVPEFLE